MSEIGTGVSAERAVEHAVAVEEAPPELLSPEKRKEFVGRSPGQLAWLRLKRDRTALASGVTVLVFILVALLAPVISAVYGAGAQETFQDQLDLNGNPLGYAGGISGEHWFGLEPNRGRDLFILMVYGLRTSLLIAFASAVITTIVGIALGVLAGYVGGWVDRVLSWLTDFTLALPFLIVVLAVVPAFEARFYGPRDEVPASFRVLLLIGVFGLFNWTYTARLVRGQVLSLREREFVEAARAAGAGAGHIMFRQLLPNIWAPVLVAFSLAVPQFITAEAALSFLSVGVPEPTPDLGRVIQRSIPFVETNPAFTFFPATAIFLVVLTFNLFGDSLRDALDPKSSR
jgi:peptide/nickel transport system permease protein